MPLVRTAWTDDDGTGTTGTVINNAEKTALYNQIDDALDPLESVVELAATSGVTYTATAGRLFRWAVGGNWVLPPPTVAIGGQRITYQLLGDSGPRTLTFSTSTAAGGFRFGVTLTSTMITAISSGRTDYADAIYSSADSKWDVVAYVKGYAQ